MIGARGHFWFMVFHFLCASIGYMLGANFLLYWAGAWSVYHAFRHMQLKEEKTDASD